MFYKRSRTIDKLRAYWDGNKQRIPLRLGINKALIAAFENSHSTQLPDDFANYLQEVDGFIGNDDPHDWSTVCDEGFYFYPLREMKSANGSSSYYIFCHDAIRLQEYAIELGHGSRNGEIAIVGDENVIRIAGSFSEFVDLYISGSELLYLGGFPAPDA